ncbi:retrotransposon protein, putative, ty3-gypsy subclass [Tanacetum coccineum]
MVTSMGIRDVMPYTLRGGPSTKLEQRLFKAWQLNNHSKNSSISSKPDRAHICTISGAIRGTATISPVQTKPMRIWMKSGEMENKVETRREATPTLWLRSPVGFEEAPNREGNKRGMNAEGGGHQPSTNMGGNLLPNGTLLSHHAQPFIPSSLHIPTGLVPIPVNPYSQPFVNLVNGQALNFPFQTQIVTPSSSYPFYTQPMYAPPNMPVYPNPAGSFTDSAGSVTPFVRGVEDISPDCKKPSHMVLTMEKGTHIISLHNLEGAIFMQKWLMPAKFRSHFSQQNKFTKIHLAVHNIKQREGESTRAFITRYSDDTLQILGLHEEQRISGFVHGLRTRSLVKHLSTYLPSTYKGLMEKTYMWVEAREVATNGASSDQRDDFKRSKKSSWDNNRGHRHKDRFSPYRGPNHGLLPNYGHDTNDCRHLRIQIQEAVNLRQLSHLVKGIKKERTKSSDTPRGESKKDKGTTPAEAPILMIFRRKEGRVYMDSESSCEIIYEHCFEKLNPTIKSTKVDLKTPLVRFSGERSWSIGEVLLEISIGNAPLSRTETLNFVIISLYQKKNRTVFLTDEANEGTKRARKIPATNEEMVLSCVNAKENIIVNEKYPDQTVSIEKQLPEHFKKELPNLLKSNADVFAWTHADMTGILRTIMVEGKPFNTEHKLNEYSHVKPIKHNKRGLGPDNNMAAWETYQRLVDKVFSHQIGRNLEAYVDDMVIKSTYGKLMLKDIQETFERFRSINMKLNPKKCSFSVEEGPFLGHLITKHGIKANPSKVKAVTDLDQPRTLKDIQSLNGKLAALNRFLSKGAERSLDFFKVLKGCKDKKNIQWTTKADKALKEMKKLVQALPTLTVPRVGETLTMHLTASKESISVVLAAKRNEGWTPIYFVSRVLQRAELNYPALEKLVLALVHAARRLRRYF